MVVYVQLAGKVETRVAVEVDVALHTYKAYPLLLRLSEGVCQQFQTLAVALAFGKDAYRSESPRRDAASVGKYQFRLREHNVPQDTAVLLHNEVKFFYEVRVVTILVQHEMLGAAGTVYVPEGFSGKVLHLAEIFCSFKSYHSVGFGNTKIILKMLIFGKKLAARPDMSTLFKSLMFALLLLAAIPGQAQKITNSNYQTVGQIKSDGTIQDKSYKTVGYIKSDGTVQDASYKTIGYLKKDGTVQDANYRTVGRIKSDGTVQDASFRTLGYVKSDGTVQNASYKTIGYAKGIPTKWAAFYFFFSAY